MYRFELDYLKQWMTRRSRKPIVIRGARQVGKSYLVKMFAAQEFSNLLEVNCERNPGIVSLFDSKTPKTIVSLLEARFDIPVTPGKTLLFLDEIQAAPEVLAVLRYFHEEMPDLHVVCAGSLLEFVLEEHSFSMPVRVARTSAHSKKRIESPPAIGISAAAVPACTQQFALWPRTA